MDIIYIKEPIWGSKSVGVAEHKINGDVWVKIQYKDQAGNDWNPHYLKMPEWKALTYPTQMRRSVKLRIIPIDDFKRYQLKDK